MPSNGSRGTARVLGLSIVLGTARASSAPPPPPPAQPSISAPSSPEVQAARELFGRAEADEDAGRWEAALEKLHKVLATKDTAGVRYHVALCEERLGKLATARSDYAAADAIARTEQAHDVLRLVGKKLSDLERRIPHVTVRVVPAAADASLTIDGQAAHAGEATAVDPGTHEVEIVPADPRPPSKVTFVIDEAESKTVDIALSPARPEPPPPATTPPPTGADLVPANRARSHTAALLEAAGAALLAGAGVLAYVEGGAARDQATRSCAALAAASASACDPYRVPVRAWDAVAIGSWAGAGAMATWAALTWTTAPGAPARVVVGAGSLRLEGKF
jgi:hypothetical protein